MLGFSPSCLNWDTPTPSPAGKTPPFGSGVGVPTRLREMGWGFPTRTTGHCGTVPILIYRVCTCCYYLILYNLLFLLYSIRSDIVAFHLGDVILTYSDSSLIEKLLLDARADKKNFKVIVSDGRVQLSGEIRFSPQNSYFCTADFKNAGD